MRFLAWLWGIGLCFGPGTTGVAVAAMPQIVAGEMHSLALDANGRLMVWGSDSYGQLGLGSLTYSTLPMAVALGTSQTKIVWFVREICG